MTLLTERVDDALKAIEAIQLEAGRIDKARKEAEQAATEAKEQAAKDRQAKRDALSKVNGLEQKVIETRAAVAGEVATLKAEKEALALRDREARDELERLRGMKEFRAVNSRRLNQQGLP